MAAIVGAEGAFTSAFGRPSAPRPRNTLRCPRRPGTVPVAGVSYEDTATWLRELLVISARTMLATPGSITWRPPKATFTSWAQA